jgi:hypothetical protein
MQGGDMHVPRPMRDWIQQHRRLDDVPPPE